MLELSRNAIAWFPFIVFFAALAVVFWTILSSRYRERQLSAQDPPTEAELAEAAALRKPGPMNLSGRESAAARHYESPMRVNPINRDGGGQTVNSPHSEGVLRSWRDKRSES